MKLRVFLIVKFFLLLCFSITPQETGEDSVYSFINSQPEGAIIRIDGKLAGITPLKLGNVEAGKHKVSAEYENKVDTEYINIGDKNYSIGFIMDGDYSLLTINTSPSNADVFIDDSLIGQTPIIDLKLARKKIRVEVSKDDYVTKTFPLNLHNRIYDFNFDLIANFSFLTLKENQRNFKIKIEDELVPNEVLSRYKIPLGYRKIEIIPKDFKTFSKIFFVEDARFYELDIKYDFFTFKNIWKSAVIPGWGQLEDGAYIKGAGLLAANALLVALTFISESNYNEYLDQYSIDRQLYLEANSEKETYEKRLQMQSSLEKVNDEARKQKIYIGTLIGTYLINLVDAFLFHSDGHELKLIELKVNENELDFSLNMNFGF